MSTLNKASDVANEILSRLATITVANGYHTDIGTLTFAGRRNISDDSIPCAVLIEGNDDVLELTTRGDAEVRQHYVAGGYVRCDPDHPNTAGHLVIKDIKRALFKDGLYMGRPAKVKAIKYEGRDIGPRADGEPIVFAVVHFSVEYAETLADA